MDLHIHIPHWLLVTFGIGALAVLIPLAVIGFLMIRSMKDFPFGA